MKTQPASRTIDLAIAHSKSGFSDTLLHPSPAPTINRLSSPAKQYARRDALSFSISFAVIAILTGAMLLYRMAVTMASLTSALFYLSLAGMLIFAVRAIVLAKQKTGDTGGE